MLKIIVYKYSSHIYICAHISCHFSDGLQIRCRERNQNISRSRLHRRVLHSAGVSGYVRLESEQARVAVCRCSVCRPGASSLREREYIYRTLVTLLTLGAHILETSLSDTSSSAFGHYQFFPSARSKPRENPKEAKEKFASFARRNEQRKPFRIPIPLKIPRGGRTEQFFRGVITNYCRV